MSLRLCVRAPPISMEVDAPVATTHSTSYELELLVPPDAARGDAAGRITAITSISSPPTPPCVRAGSFLAPTCRDVEPSRWRWRGTAPTGTRPSCGTSPQINAQGLHLNGATGPGGPLLLMGHAGQRPLGHDDRLHRYRRRHRGKLHPDDPARYPARGGTSRPAERGRGRARCSATASVSNTPTTPRLHEVKPALPSGSSVIA